MNQRSPLEVPGRLHVNPTMFPGPLVAPHLVASQNGSHLQLISMGGETKLEKLAGQLVAVQLEHLLSASNPPAYVGLRTAGESPPDHLEPAAYPPAEVPRLTDDQVATITENAIHLAGATLEMVFRTQQARPASTGHEDGEEAADNANQ